MKNYLSIIVSLFILLTWFTVCGGQSQNTNQEKATENKTAPDQKQPSLEDYGVTINILAEFIESEKPLFTESKSNDNTWTKKTSFLQSWTYWESNRYQQVTVGIVSWDADIEKVKGTTIEGALANDYRDMVKDKQRKFRGGYKVEKLNYLEIDGVKGAFSQEGGGKSKNQMFLIWKGYFYYKGNLQELLVMVSGERKDLPKLINIIKSMKLTK